jgi:hypothetical protein
MSLRKNVATNKTAINDSDSDKQIDNELEVASSIYGDNNGILEKEG